MRRPAPTSLSGIRHPGPQAEDRRPFAPCTAETVSIEVEAGQSLLDALGEWAAAREFESAVLDLRGLSLDAFDFVMPDRAIDDRHAAWYSDPHSSKGAVLTDAVAILGWRDGDWFAHIHAYWLEDGRERLGHLLPHSLFTKNSANLSGHGIKGARFEAALDPETEFILFRVKPVPGVAADAPANALITTLAPFEDLHDSVEALAATLRAEDYEVSGLGSFAGAGFQDAAPMTGLISEILLQKNAGARHGKDLSLPVRCVDLNGKLYQGTLKPGQAPTLVTCELLIRRY